MLANYLFCALAGTTWYFQFFFYSMGETQMGKYKFSSWTLHMASIIIFSSLVGHRIERMEGRGSAGRPDAGSGSSVAGGIDRDCRLRKLCGTISLGF